MKTTRLLLAYLIDPFQNRAWVYLPSAPVREHPYDMGLSGHEVLPGISFCPARIDRRQPLR